MSSVRGLTLYSRKADPNLQRQQPPRVVNQAPEVRFAVVGNARTGSSHLVSLLDSHPDIACWDDEIFDEGEAFDKSSYTDPREFLCNQVFKVNARAAGFKLLWDAMNHVADGWTWLKEFDIRLVHTYRANYLDSYISYKLAAINKAFTCWYGEYTTYQFEADFDECLEWFWTVEECDAEIRRRSIEEGISRMEIEYHELCESQDRVLDFLNVSRHPLHSKLRKQRKGTQVEIITNFAELRRRFAESRWAEHFET